MMITIMMIIGEKESLGFNSYFLLIRDLDQGLRNETALLLAVRVP